MKNQLAGLMKQAQAMQRNMEKVQEELGKTIVEGQSGAGMVSVLMSCKFYVSRVSIDPSLMSDDKEMLEDLITAAVNDAVRKAEHRKKWLVYRRVLQCLRDSKCRFKDTDCPRETAFIPSSSDTGFATFARSGAEICTAYRISYAAA